MSTNKSNSEEGSSKEDSSDEEADIPYNITQWSGVSSTHQEIPQFTYEDPTEEM